MPYTDKQLARHRAVMAAGDPVPVALETHEGQRGTGTLRLLRLSPAAQGARARRWLLTFLLLAPPSVLFPPHLLWPLAMVTVGVVGYFLRRGRAELVLGGEAHCPACQAFQILAPGNAEFPLAHFCSECRRRSLVAPVASAQPAATDG